jgi:hypothetical protein
LTSLNSLTRYANLLALAEFIAYSIESSPPVYQTVQEMAGRARQAWTVWKRLDGQCADAASCVRLTGELTSNAIAT